MEDEKLMRIVGSINTQKKINYMLGLEDDNEAAE